MSISLKNKKGSHLNHPYEDLSLTFYDIKEIFKKSLNKTLNEENDLIEKIDGQAISFTFKNEEFRFIRNKTERKNYCENAFYSDDTLNEGKLTANKRFENTPDNIKRTFIKACQSISNVMSIAFSNKSLNEIFKEGKYIMNCEIVHEDTYNIINYFRNSIIFHQLTEIDEKGNEISTNTKSVSEIISSIKLINESMLEEFSFESPNKVDYLDLNEKLIRSIIDDIDTVKYSRYLTDESTLGDYLRKRYTKKLESLISIYDVKNISESQREGILMRWVEHDKSYNLRDIKKEINNESFTNFISAYEKNDMKNDRKEFLSFFEMKFHSLSNHIIENIRNPFTKNREKSKNIMIDKLNEAKNLFKSDKNLTKITDLGGINKSNPVEGVVFVYKNKQYKLTGSFAPINQLLGKDRYNR
jgi:hypothetical protein